MAGLELDISFEQARYEKLIQIEVKQDISNIIQYMDSLSYPQKINLLTRFISLSYDKNIFEYFQSFFVFL